MEITDFLDVVAPVRYSRDVRKDVAAEALFKLFARGVLTAPDLARLAEEERAHLRGHEDHRESDCPEQFWALRLAQARAVVEAARRLNERMPVGSLTARDILIVEVLEVCKAVAAYDAARGDT